MSSTWKLGKKLKEANPLSSKSSSSSNYNSNNYNNYSSNVIGGTSVSTASGGPIHRSGVLTIRVVEAKDIQLPSGIPLPPQIEKALSTQSASTAASVTSSSVNHARQSSYSSNNRDSLQRKQCWWLPYIVLEFDKNEILIDALGGKLNEPVWMYKAHFDVSRASEISISTYLRTGYSNFPGQTNSTPNDMGNSDLFLGAVKFIPDFDSNVSYYIRIMLLISRRMFYSC